MGPEFDIIVVGAGPAGSSAAAALAESGFRVAIIEKSTRPGSKPCAGGLVMRGVQRLPKRVLNSVERYCFETQVNILSAGLSFVTKRPQPIIAMVMRQHFDRLLLEEAISAGALLFDGQTIKRVRNTNQAVHIVTNGTPLTASYLIAADGALSPVARGIGLYGQVELVPAIECEIEVTEALFDQYCNAARFDLGFVPQGYGWVFPKKDHLSVGVGRLRRGNTRLGKYLDEYLSFLRLSDCRILEKNASIISLWAGRNRFASGRVLLTGDAAGLADPLTAEGISNAMLSGQLAANAIRGAEKYGIRDAATYYEKLLKQKIIKEIRVASKVSEWIYDYPKVMHGAFAIYGERICEGMIQIMLGQTSYIRVLANPLTYLRPFTFGGKFTRRSKIDKTRPFG